MNKRPGPATISSLPLSYTKNMLRELEIARTTELGDFRNLVLVFENVFDMKAFHLPPDVHLENLLGEENFVAVTAKLGERVIGGMTGYVLHQYYSTKPLFYIYDLAILEEYQRMGVGKQLISFINDLCRQRGFEEVFVQADKVDEYAVDFYRSTNPTEEEQVLHFYYTL